MTCIEFEGYRTPKGYGRLQVRGKKWLAHRLAWVEAHGDPGDLCVLHACDNPGCVNVDHLFLGTVADNNHDRDRKGRHHNVRKTHCPRGHEYDHVNAGGRRWCHQCDRDNARRRYENLRN